MNRDSFHRTVTAAVAAEGFKFRKMPTSRLYRTAVDLARYNAQMDWADERNVSTHHFKKGHSSAPVITQQQASRAISLMIGDQWNGNYSYVHRWHFDPFFAWENFRHHLEAFLKDRTTGSLMAAAAHLHRAQDTTGPHRGFVGFPHRINYDRTKAMGKLRWYMRALPADEIYGHCLYRSIDNIENCRDGAIESVLRAYEILSGGDSGDNCEVAKILQTVKNDNAMQAQCAKFFRYICNETLPDYLPVVPGTTDFFIWCDVVR